jgi:ABC-2 type transport system permease protein
MSLRASVRAYPTLLKIGLYSAFAYRAEFVVWMLSMTMPLVMLALTSAIARDAPLGRFDAPTFTAYYLATLIVRQLTGAWVVWEMVMEIREGVLAQRMLRPIHPLLAYSADSLSAIPMRAMISLPIAVILLLSAGGTSVTHDPVRIALFVLAVAGAWLLNFAVSATIGSLAFFVQSSLAVWELWLGCFMIFSGYLLPLELFPHWLERIARVLPFAYLQAMPVEILTGLHDRAASVRAVGVQLAWAAGALVLMQLAWRQGSKRFSAYGG